MPGLAPVTSVVTLAGKALADDTTITTPPPPGEVAGALIDALPVDGPLMYLAASITTPPPACVEPPAPPRRNVGLVFDAFTTYPRTA